MTKSIHLAFLLFVTLFILQSMSAGASEQPYHLPVGKFSLTGAFSAPAPRQEDPWRVSIQEPLSGKRLEMKATRHYPLASSQIAMGDLRLPAEFALMPALSGKGLVYTFDAREQFLRNVLLVEEKRNYRQQIAATTLRTGLPFDNADLTISAVSGSTATAMHSETTNMVLAKGRLLRPLFQLQAETALSMPSSSLPEGPEEDKAYRFSGETAIVGFRYNGIYQYIGPNFNFLKKTAQQPDTVRKELRISRDSILGRLSLLLTDVQTNVEENPSYSGRYREVAEIELAAKPLGPVSSTLFLQRGTSGTRPPGGNRTPFSRFDAAGGTISFGLKALDLKLRTHQTWVRDHATGDALSRELGLEVNPLLTFPKLVFEPSFAMQRQVDIPTSTTETVYNIDLGLRKKLNLKTDIDLGCGYTGKKADSVPTSESYRGKVALNLKPTALPLGFARSRVSLMAERSKERLFALPAGRNYSFLLTLELS